MNLFLGIAGLFFLRSLHTESIPLIRNVYLRPIGYSRSNSIVEHNRSCEQCLCQIFRTDQHHQNLALNCFSNGTCEYFSRFPISYEFERMNGSKLYFPQKIFPNRSTCCQPNLTELLQRLRNTTPEILNLTIAPTAFGYDENNPDEAVVIGQTASQIIWFHPMTLTLLRNFSTWTSSSVELYDDLLLTSTFNIPTIHVFNRTTMTLITNITYPTLSQTRRYIFFNQSRLLIANTQSNRSLTVFDVLSPTIYRFRQIIPFPIAASHGFVKVNETFFYASAWTGAPIYSYTYRNGFWNFSNFSASIPGISGSHLRLDDCGRIWHIIPNIGLYIYDPSSGIRLGMWNISLASDSLYDLLLLRNYVFLLSRPNSRTIYRYQPEIFC